MFLQMSPDGDVGLYSRNNRRLLALLMFQAVRRGQLVQVRCRIYKDDDPRPAPTDDPKDLATWCAKGPFLPLAQEVALRVL